MSKRKNTIIIIISIILLIGIISVLILNNNSQSNLKKVNYNEVNSMIENKESFVLCISRTTCSHCNDFKPKLNEVAKKYDKTIYYIDIDKETEENQEKFNELISFDGSTPTTVFIKDGEEQTTANRIEGDTTKGVIIKKLKANKVID